MNNDGLRNLILKKLQAAAPETLRHVLRVLADIETRDALQDARFDDSFTPFFGLTRDSQAFDGDPVEMQRRRRAE
jgi:hypothetical protein